MLDWQPSASLETLRLRARILQQIRAFFSVRDVLEVETPAMSHAGTTDPNIHSFSSTDPERKLPYYLHTSPEFPMKRLLAAGSGAIYQLARVFRQGEAGRRHNPEFTLLEWYRPGFDHHQLMDDVEALIRDLLSPHMPLANSQRMSYAQAFESTTGLAPFDATVADMQAVLKQKGVEVSGLDDEERDAWLDVLMTHVVEPGLPQNGPVFIYDFPASQAALAKIRPGDPAVAERFELYINGMELANGFHELSDAREQRSRFETENQRRKQQGFAEIPIDENLIAALEAGLPESAGVALGVDRLLMLASDKSNIAEVIAFDTQRS